MDRRLGKGVTHRRGLYAEAAATLERALEVLPEVGPHAGTRAEGLVTLASALLHLGREAEARQRLESLAADPFSPEAPRHLARRVLEAL